MLLLRSSKEHKQNGGNKMKTFQVRLTNGHRVEVKEMAYHKDWAANQQQAESMAQTMSNKEWKVIPSK
jgi:hypothetical protein